MPTYVFQCPDGHVTELVQSIHDDLPAEVPCDAILCDHCDGCEDYRCGMPCLTMAARVFLAPAAIHFKGPGFYATDVKGSQERKRRKNPGDDLHRDHQPDTAAIARSL